MTQPTHAGMVELVKNQVHESARKVRYYGYLARHLTRINDTLQFIGVIASCLAVFTLLGGLEAPSLVLIVTASFTLTLCTLRNYASRSHRSSEISLQLAQLHLDWHSLWNETLSNDEYDSFTRFKQLYARQLAIQELIPLDLTLSPWLARRAQNIPHNYWIAALNNPSPDARSTSPGAAPAQSL